jgi:hypothetical protein
MLSQQRGSRLRSTVRNDPDNLSGKAGYFERIGATAMVERFTRHQDTPQVNTPHSRRRVTLRDFEWADLIDPQDVARMLANPQNRYVMNAMWAAGRQIDDLIVAAANGNAYSMDSDDAATTVALPSAQKVAVASAGLTLAKLLSTKEILDGAEVDPEEPRYLIHTAKQATNLLNTTEIKSADYNSVKALAEGKIDTFLGFKFIRSERLSRNTVTDVRTCFAWHKSGIKFAEGGRNVHMDVLPSKRHCQQIRGVYRCGAVRTQNEKVVRIYTDESP